MRGARRVLALGWFAARANLRSAMALGGMAAFAAIALLGPIFSVRNGTGWALDTDLLFYGFLTGALFVVRSGLEHQRESGLAAFLRHNLSSPVEHAAGAVVSVLGSWLAMMGLLFVVGLVCSGGDAGRAAWLAFAWGMALGMLLPFVVMIESSATLRVPLMLPVLGYLILMGAVAWRLGETRMATYLGFRGNQVTLDNALWLMGRTGVILAIGMGAFLAGTWLLARWAAVPRKVVASSHGGAPD